MNDKSLKMGQEKITKLLLTMSLPAILSMLVQALYNIVDSIFISKYSSNGLAALTFAFPMQMLQLAFALGIGVGTSSLLSRKLGQGSKEEANRTAKTGLSLAIILGTIFMFFSFIAPELFMSLFTKNHTIIALGVSYLSIVMLGCVPSFIEITSSKILQGTGNMKIPMLAQLIGAITNIILDPIFIFVFDLGVSGAALATIIGQLAAMIFSVSFLLFKKQDIKISFESKNIDGRLLKEIIQVGLPATIMNAIASFTTIIMYSILVPYGEEAAVILGIYFKLQSFIFMPVFGLTQGALPILAYNYGAQKKERFYQTFFLSLGISLSIMTIGFCLFQVFPTPFIKMFNSSKEYVSMGSIALRIISISFIPAAFGIIIATTFQAIGHGTKSLIMSLLRQIIFLLPSAYFLGRLFGLNALWSSYAIAEGITIILFLPISLVVIKKQFIKSTMMPR